MAKKRAKQASPKQVEALKHAAEKRRNIPTAEFQSVMEKEEQRPLLVAYERRNPDLDPQLVWRGKDLKGSARWRIMPASCGAAALEFRISNGRSGVQLTP